MPIINITQQPSTDSIFAAYRPIIFLVEAQKTDLTPTPPVVYCDVYFGGVYYKSSSKTQFKTLGSTSSFWEFDIQDACQEVIKKIIADNLNASILDITQAIKSCYCKFRSSGIDVNGFVTPEGTAPIQATSLNNAVSGTGTQSNTFFVVNATLQHVSNQNLQAHLNYFKVGTWDSATYPLTERKAYKICKQDTDHFGILTNKVPSCITISYKLKVSPSVFIETSCRSIGGPPPVCIGVTLGSYLLPVAVNGVHYDQSIFLFGDPPFVYDNINSANVPSWMSVNIINLGGGNFSVQLIGTPSSDDDLSDLDIVITNCSGVNNAHILGNQPICTAIGFGTVSLPDGEVGVHYSGSVQLTGTSPFSIISINSMPAGLTATIVGSNISITGTPTTSGNNQPINITVGNCTSDSDIFSDTINIAVATPSITLNSSPSCRVSGNCNDNFTCSIRFNIDTQNAPTGSHIVADNQTGSASVSVTDNLPPSGVLDYTEPNGGGTVTFDLKLIASDNVTILATQPNVTISHQSFWNFLSICT